MLLFDILLAIVVLRGLCYCSKNNEEYLNKDTTNSIKGVFVFMILLSHLLSFLIEKGVMLNTLDYASLKVHAIFGQLVVSTFLFYSGYGVMLSIIKKGDIYICSLFSNRVLITWLNFCIAVVFYIIINILCGKSLSVSSIFTSFIAWTTIGNNCWYIFCILFCYLVTGLSFSFYNGTIIQKRLSLYNMMVLLIGCCLYCYLIPKYKEAYWYDMTLCYFAGLLYAPNANRFEIMLKRNYKVVLFILALSFLSLYLIIPRIGIDLFDNFEGIVFCFLIVTLSYKFSFKSSVLLWLGRSIFPI